MRGAAMTSARACWSAVSIVQRNHAWNVCRTLACTHTYLWGACEQYLPRHPCRARGCKPDIVTATRPQQWQSSALIRHHCRPRPPARETCIIVLRGAIAHLLLHVAPHAAGAAEADLPRRLLPRRELAQAAYQLLPLRAQPPQVRSQQLPGLDERSAGQSQFGRCQQLPSKDERSAGQPQLRPLRSESAGGMLDLPSWLDNA